MCLHYTKISNAKSKSIRVLLTITGNLHVLKLLTPIASIYFTN